MFLSALRFVDAGDMLELSEAIRDYHDHTVLPHMVNYGLQFNCHYIAQLIRNCFSCLLLGNWQLHTVKHVIYYRHPDLMHFAVQFMNLYFVSSCLQLLIFLLLMYLSFPKRCLLEGDSIPYFIFTHLSLSFSLSLFV